MGRMKKGCCGILMLLCGIILCTGCGTKKEKLPELTEKDNGFSWQSSITAGNGGYYFYRTEDVTDDGSYLYFTDGDLENCVKLCGKADCTHDTGDCNAFVSGMVSMFLTYANDRLYYMQTIDKSRISLCSMSKDGTNHREIVSLLEVIGNDTTGQSTYIDAGFLHEGYLYYLVDQAEGTELLYRVSISEGSKPELFLQVEGGRLASFLADGDCLYFSRSWIHGDLDSAGEIVQMSLSTKEEQILFRFEEKQVVSSMALTDKYLYYSIGTEGVCRRELSTGNEVWLEADLPEYAFINTDGKYLYVDNGGACDVAYFLENDKKSYDNREILVLDLDGNPVDKFSLPGIRELCEGGDDRYLFWLVLVDGQNELYYYDKKQIGTGNGAIAPVGEA